LRGIARDAGLGGGVLALGVASTLATVWVMGIQADRDRYQAEAAQPRPTVTRTTTEAPVSAHRSPHPSPPSSMPSAERTFLAAGEPARGAGGDSGSDRGGVSGSRSGPASPAPSPEPPASSGRGVSVRLPLGVLPDVGVHLTIGANR
jgi:hypothetical protein